MYRSLVGVVELKKQHTTDDPHTELQPVYFSVAKFTSKFILFPNSTLSQLTYI